jgi:putative spermidine/putrescine transport system permease protein/spermidine/putrescine transport system permease protein
MTEASLSPGSAIERVNADALHLDEVRERRRIFGLSLPSLAVIALILVLPIVWLFGLSFAGSDGSLSWEHYERLYRRSYYLKIFYTTFEVSVVVTVICVLVGYPLAYLLAQMPRRAANLCMIAVILPLWTSVLVRTYAWLVLLQKTGLINGWLIGLGIVEEPIQLVHNYTGTVIGMTHIMLPFLILPLYASMKAIDMDYVRAAANLGADPVHAFWQIFFPLSLPGLFAGILLIFVLCLGFYVTPALLGGGRVIMIAMKIQTNVVQYPEWGASSSLGMVLLIMTFALLWIVSRVFRLVR